MGEDINGWDEYILEHSDLEWSGEGGLTEPTQQNVIAFCAIFFDPGN